MEVFDLIHREDSRIRKIYRRILNISLVFIVTLLLAGCSSAPIDYNTLTQQKISELEAQATLYQEQCNKLDSTKKDIDNLKAYINGKEMTHVVPTTTKGFGRCIDNSDTMSEKRVEYENFTLNIGCNKFAGFKGCYENSKESCLIFKSPEDMNNQLQ